MGKKLPAGARGSIAALIVLVLALAALGPTVANASAEVLLSQPPGPSGVGMPSDESPTSHKAYDNFVVADGGHWQLEAIRVFGAAKVEHPRTFNVEILFGGSGAADTYPLDVPDERIFRERVTVAGGPDYLIPLEGVPRLSPDNPFGQTQYWISVQAVSEGGEDEWSWLTGPDTAGTAPAYGLHEEGAESGLAFELLGTAMQKITAEVDGLGTLVSVPPGLSCTYKCTAEFPRGTALTFSAVRANPSLKLIEWGFRAIGFSGLGGIASIPALIPSPCSGSGGCAFTLTEDTNVGAVFEPNNEFTVTEVVRDRRDGRGELLISIPGPGVIGMRSNGLKGYGVGPVPAGVVKIPLVPTKRVAKVLRRRGRATVSVKVSFVATGRPTPGVVQVPVTLFRKRTKKPAKRIH
jgi:hypothetical protein